MSSATFDLLLFAVLPYVALVVFFLATVLQGVQAERRQKAGFMISENSEDAALFTGFVIIVIKMDHTRHAPA